MGILREMWTGRIQRFLTNADKNNFLIGLQDYSPLVKDVGNEAQAIHLLDIGVLPEVLINNTTYPIDIVDQAASDIIIQLDKYQTKVTPITDDEAYASTYEKIQVTVNRHGLAIRIAKYKKAIHALAPSGNTVKMPVLVTTGPDDGTGRRELLWEDVSRFKTACDNLEIPEDGRRFVLCKDHENDLVKRDQKFKDQYYNRESGKVYNQLGFMFYDYSGNPYYNPTTKAKLSFGAVPSATDRKASVFFSESRAVMADGWTKMYFSPANMDPQNQRNLVNFRHNYIVMPTAEEARGAIISDNAQ